MWLEAPNPLGCLHVCIAFLAKWVQILGLFGASVFEEFIG
jgi:hypothetical protein